MRRPRFETWFMEGSLRPGVHYVALKDDYSDLEDKILHYRRHPEQARSIIANAQRHAAQFKDFERERLIALLVIDRYLRLSRQL